MADKKKIAPKVCNTASALLIHQNKILLIKHKKLQSWMGPGGHIDENELPHHAAEREFWEETGLKVKVVNSVQDMDSMEGYDNFRPVPFATNLHWISEKNYENRLQSLESGGDAEREELWQKGCEQHFNLSYLAQADGDLDFHHNVEEVDEIAWFSLDEVKDLEEKGLIYWGIFQEILRAFELVKKLGI